MLKSDAIKYIIQVLRRFIYVELAIVASLAITLVVLQNFGMLQSLAKQTMIFIVVFLLISGTMVMTGALTHDYLDQTLLKKTLNEERKNVKRKHKN